MRNNFMNGEITAVQPYGGGLLPNLGKRPKPKALPPNSGSHAGCIHRESAISNSYDQKLSKE